MADLMIRRAGEWLSSMVGDELVMMNVQNGNYVTVTRVGARIWELLEQPRSMDDLCNSLMRDYDVTPEACRADVQHFLDEMAANGAVTLGPAPAA
jgi:hypothetical protein